jgi:pimeloyl-ACP methyl ester carboxylesterase
MISSRRSTLASLCLLLAFAPPTVAAEYPTSFHVQVTGSGRPILLVPGLASSGDTWTTTVAHLSSRFTCHVLTLAGFAGTAPIDAPLFPTVRRELADYIRAHRLDRPIVIGHSLGGMLAMALAADHPDLVGPIVLVDAMPFLAGPNLQVKTLEEARPTVARIEGYMSAMTKQQWDTYATSGASTRYMVTSASDAETLVKWSATTDRQTLTRALVEAYRVDLREDIARIVSPVLALGTWRGWHDQLAANKIEVPKEAFVGSFAEQFARLPRLHFELHDTARHFIMWDDSAWFFRQIDSFIADPIAATRDRGVEGQ